MAWATPRTWVTGEVVRARYFNTNVRDNMRVLAGTYVQVSTTETTTSGTFVDLATVGPQVVLSLPADQTTAMIFWGCICGATNGLALMAIALTGDTVFGAADDYSCNIQSTGSALDNIMGAKIFTALGQNVTFTAKYRGTAATTSSYQQRWILAYAIAN